MDVTFRCHEGDGSYGAGGNDGLVRSSYAAPHTLESEGEQIMAITDTVRRSTWQRRSTGRRTISDEAPYSSIGEAEDVTHRDARRRSGLARTAGLGA